MAPKKVSLEERFWKNVEKTDSCWNWKGKTGTRGYGSIYDGDKCKSAHRLSLELHGYEVPSWSVVMHKCDNPKCVNPNHLQIGTHRTNQLDKVIKGRQAKGEKQGNSILSVIEVKAMKELYKCGWKIADIAAALKREYSPTWQAIKNGWKYLD